MARGISLAAEARTRWIIERAICTANSGGDRVKARAHRDVPCLVCGQPVGRAWRGWRIEGACSKVCAYTQRRQQAESYLAGGGPLLAQVDDEHVVCLICHRTLRQASTHFSSTHGLPLHKGMGHLERQAIYRMPMGSRMVSPASIERNRLRGKRPENLTRLKPLSFRLGSTNPPPTTGALLGATVQRSDKQRAILSRLRGSPRHGSAVRHELAKRSVPCARCGTMIEKTIGYFRAGARKGTNGKRFCSRSCASQIINATCMTEDSRRRQREGILRARSLKSWSSRPAVDYRVDMPCKQCGETFSIIKSKAATRHYCTSFCYQQSRRTG
jgi:hypothetical protein